MIYSPNDFTPNLTGAPFNITTLYIYANTSASNASYTNFTVKIGHSNLSVFTSNTWATGLTQVYFAATQSFGTVTAGQWLQLNLQTPFTWDGTSNIIVELSQTAYTGGGFNLWNENTTGNKRLHGGVNAANATNFASGQSHIGFNISPVSCSGVPSAGVITATSSTITCGGNASFSATSVSTGGGIKLTWQKSIDNGSTWVDLDTGTTALNLISVTQPTSVRLKAFCPNSSQSGYSNKIDVNVTPVPLNLGRDTAICNNATINLSIPNSFAGSTILWDNNSNTLTRIIDQPGVYSARVQMANGCVATDTIIIRDGQEPTAPFLTAYDLCKDSLIVLNAQNIGMRYLWNDNTTNQTLAVRAPGFYSVQITSLDNCTGSYATVVEERPLPIIDLPNELYICYGDSTLLNGTAIHGANYLWNNGRITPNIWAKDVCVYKLKVLTQYGCIATDSVSLWHRPRPLTNGFTYIPGFYNNEKKVVFAPINPENIDSYHWDFGDGKTSTLREPTHIYDDYGVYAVTLKVSNNCNETIYNQNINLIFNGTDLDQINSGNGIVIYPNPAQNYF